MHIDRYGFGTLVADGREIHTDVLPTVAAVDRINELLRLGAVGWAFRTRDRGLGLHALQAAETGMGPGRMAGAG